MAEEDAIWALGCMSGTSMDGVDAAMVLTDGVEVFEFGATGFRPYSAVERGVLASAQGKWPDEAGVAEACAVIERAHQEVIARFGGVALVGFHGQTLAHDPRGRGTHQAGDGARLAAATNHAVAWDFRSADVAAGGQGAPLAPFYHFALAKRFSLGRVAFLNLGGVGNITFVDADKATPEDEGALLAFDTGPANALIDDFVRARTGLACDYGGAMAASGKADNGITERFLASEYFSRTPPKSLDRNEFKGLAKDVENLSDEDGAATLTEATVRSVARAFEAAPFVITKILLCGGGRKNTRMVEQLARHLPACVVDIDAEKMDGDMLEAQAFAYLAVRVKQGLPLSSPSTTGVSSAIPGGRISPA